MEINEIWQKFKDSKKIQIISIVCLLLIGCSVVAGIFFFSDKKDNAKTNSNAVQVASSNSNIYPTTIMIENYKDVRPQYGLSSADIVYEALAEGGITRFLAVYTNDENIDNIGPVRSARHYFVDLAEEYHGLFAHIGGSPEALGILSVQDYLTDLNQFGYSEYYWRDEEKDAPHNLFTSTELLAYAKRDLDLPTEASYDKWQYKESEPINTTEQDIIIDFSSEDYKTEWKYDANTNSYLRFNGNSEHKDANNDKQITSNNVILQYVETSLMDNATGRLDIITQGEGKAVVFSNNSYTEGTWKKAERGQRTRFYDSNNEEIILQPGITWVELVQDSTEISWIK